MKVYFLTLSTTLLQKMAEVTRPPKVTLGEGGIYCIHSSHTHADHRTHIDRAQTHTQTHTRTHTQYTHTKYTQNTQTNLTTSCVILTSYALIHMHTHTHTNKTHTYEYIHTRWETHTHTHTYTH